MRPCKVALRVPYVLSFATLRHFDALFTELTLDDGRRGLGEVVPLPGYSDDDVAGTLHAATALASRLRGLAVDEARATVRREAFGTCAAALLLTAIDGLQVPTTTLRQPIITATSTRVPDLGAVLAAAADAGFRTVKVKLGPDADADVACLRLLGGQVPPGMRLRFDANQAYDEAGATRVLACLQTHLSAATELLEQPLHRDAWDAFARLAKRATVALMLDESIRDATDIDRAATVGARLVKLKIYKQGGAAEVRQLAQRAQSLGMGVVLGNGVATDVTNLLELQLQSAHPELFHGASEAVGFAKLVAPVLHPGLLVEAGQAVFRPPA